VKLTPVVESAAGVRTREPDCCMITASVPPMLARSLKVETGGSVSGPVLGAALGATEGTAEGATLPGAVLGIGGCEPLGMTLGAALGMPLGAALGISEGIELGPMEGWRLSGLTLPVGEADG
jgi:hypothetical protein